MFCCRTSLHFSQGTVMKINIHCRAELDPLYGTMRILEAEEEDTELTLWAVYMGSRSRQTKVKARRPHGTCSWAGPSGGSERLNYHNVQRRPGPLSVEQCVNKHTNRQCTSRVGRLMLFLRVKCGLKGYKLEVNTVINVMEKVGGECLFHGVWEKGY